MRRAFSTLSVDSYSSKIPLLAVEISLSETGDRGSECDDCRIRSHVFCIRSHESLFRSHERQIRSGRIVCNPLAEWALCFFSSEVSQRLSSESEVISASSSAIPHWAVKVLVLFLHLWPYVCCLDFDCKVRYFFCNRCYLLYETTTLILLRKFSIS